MMKHVAIILIRVYQLTFSRILPRTCRFAPSCSQYAIDALNSHGALKGSILSLLRILRCQPFCSGGLDPVPRPGITFIEAMKHRSISKEYSNE